MSTRLQWWISTELSMGPSRLPRREKYFWSMTLTKQWLRFRLPTKVAEWLEDTGNRHKIPKSLSSKRLPKNS
eukprot:9170726-Heterocapsa_arctica.AAC.1